MPSGLSNVNGCYMPPADPLEQLDLAYSGHVSLRQKSACLQAFETVSRGRCWGVEQQTAAVLPREVRWLLLPEDC